MKRQELLSPVGNMEMLYQAIHNGADAVYLAGTSYGARKFAKNFSKEELVDAIQYARLYGVKVYVTVNTLIYEYELDDVIDYLGFLYKNGVDAVIMQDMGLIRLTRKIYPNLEIHASTQCHNHNKEITSLWKDLGITRVVFAREMSLDQIKDIDVDIEKEVFVYGALCVCYSGCCLFSSLNGGRSGNRGECVGSCRLPYKLIMNDKEIEAEGNYLLSAKELNTLDRVGELIEAGIDSFKIEGRMKSPAYVGYVTRLYRMLIDKYYRGEEVKLSEEEIFNLKKLFNREFTKGYLFKENDIMNIQTPNHLGVEIGRVVDVFKDKIKIELTKDDLSQNDGIRFRDKNEGMIVNRLYDKKMLLTNKISNHQVCYLDNKLGIKKGDILLKTVDSQLIKELEDVSMKKIPITMKVKALIGKNLELEISDCENKVIVTSNVVDKAIKREVIDTDIERQLGKLGNTPFKLKNIKIDKDDNIFINLKDLNDIRRNGIDRLIDLRKNKPIDYVVNNYEEEDSLMENDNDSKISLNILVRNEEQLKCCLEENVNTIYVTDEALYKKYKQYNNVYYRLDRVNQKYSNLEDERLLVGELGSVEKYRMNNTLIGDYYLNVINHHSIDLLCGFGLERVTLSVELDDAKIQDIMKKQYPVELVIYGRLELMVMKYCPLKKCLKYCNSCKDSQDKFGLKDRQGNYYPMIRKNCLTYIMHHQVIDKINDVSKYKDMGIRHYRLELFDEDVDQIRELIHHFYR